MRGEPVSTTRRVAYALIDGLVFLIVWQVVVSKTGVRPPFAFMQQYSPSDFSAYITVMSWMTLILFFLSVLMHRFFGGSVGKLVFGARTRRLNGESLGWRLAITRALAMYALGLMILAPGPLAAYILGSGSEWLSMTLLFGGLMTWLIFVLAPGEHRADGSSNLLEQLLAIKTVWVRAEK